MVRSATLPPATPGLAAAQRHSVEHVSASRSTPPPCILDTSFLKPTYLAAHGPKLLVHGIDTVLLHGGVEVAQGGPVPRGLLRHACAMPARPGLVDPERGIPAPQPSRAAGCWSWTGQRTYCFPPSLGSTGGLRAAEGRHCAHCERSGDRPHTANPHSRPLGVCAGSSKYSVTPFG